MDANGAESKDRIFPPSSPIMVVIFASVASFQSRPDVVFETMSKDLT